MRGYYSVHELAQHVGVSDRTIERWYAQKKIPKPAVVDERGWKFWSADQGRQILAWHLSPRKKRSRKPRGG